MAIIHRAQLRPTKLEILADWLPSRQWFAGGEGDLVSVGAYRFDDPAGEVGIETLLLCVGDGPIIQVPLTYRGAPLSGADDGFITTIEHSVLGTRWVYDGCTDPVYVESLAAAITGRRPQAAELVEGANPREPTARVTGAGVDDVVDVPATLSVDDITHTTEGAVTVCRTPAAEVRVRHLPTPADAAGGACLTGTWRGQADPVVLATASPV